MAIPNRSQQQLSELYKGYSGSRMFFSSLPSYFTLFIQSGLANKTVIYSALS